MIKLEVYFSHVPIVMQITLAPSEICMWDVCFCGCIPHLLKHIDHVSAQIFKVAIQFCFRFQHFPALTAIVGVFRLGKINGLLGLSPDIVIYIFKFFFKKFLQQQLDFIPVAFAGIGISKTGEPISKIT